MTTLATDSFTRADSASLGAGWTEDTSDSGLSIAGNKVIVGGSEGAAYYTGVVFPNNQWGQAVLNGGDGGGIALRGVDGASTNCYVVNIEGGFGVGVSLIFGKFVAGSFSLIDSQSVTFNSGDTLYAEIQGTTLLAKRNGSALGASTTDVSHSSGSPGLFGFGAYAADDFAAGDFAGADTLMPQIWC